MVAQYSPVVTCFERFGTAHEEYDDERGLMSASVQLFCAYGDRHALAGDLLSNHRAWPKGSSSLVPLAYGCAIEPWDDVGSVDGQTISPGTALVTARYSTKRVELITEELEPVVEAVRADHKLFAWNNGSPLLNELGGPLLDVDNNPVFGDGTPVNEDQAPIWQRRSLNIVRTEMFVIPPLPDALFDFVGGCNESDYVSGLLGKTFKAQTLIFNPAVLRVKYDSTGALMYDITKRFNYVPWGANRFWNQTLGGYCQFVYRGTGVVYNPFPPVNFTQLASPTQPYTI